MKDCSLIANVVLCMQEKIRLFSRKVINTKFLAAHKIDIQWISSLALEVYATK